MLKLGKSSEVSRGFQVSSEASADLVKLNVAPGSSFSGYVTGVLHDAYMSGLA